ncbi:hypothetical protein PCANC_15625 [Puccinia coronata f. sp. avenae]|uniref:Uncharacterized protein n=1 Tax=Puccinia coronata f. sp. avenae TaxID=200324 RepID=A0A2N5SF80_9BASI|nr:hypothetical protein PCANC_15625 [Puccinia coronata f. sp. avenae]
MVCVLLHTVTLVSVLFISSLPFSQATPITTSSFSSSGFSSGESYVNGHRVSGHCQASKNGYTSNCNDPSFSSIPNVITNFSQGNYMPPFRSFPNMNNFWRGFQQQNPAFPNFFTNNYGFPGFPAFAAFPGFPN